MSNDQAIIRDIVEKLKELDGRATAPAWEAQHGEVVASDSMETVCRCAGQIERASENAELIAVCRTELPRLLDFLEKSIEVTEKAKTLLVNAYSIPDDEKGIRFNSEDAVRLQWALKNVGAGGDAGEPYFAV